MLPTTKKTNSKKKNKDNKGKGFRFMGVDFGKDRTKGKVEAKSGGRLTDKDNSAIVLDGKTKTKRKVKTAKGGGSLKDVPANKTGLAKLPSKVRNKMGYAKSGGSISDTKNAKPKSNPKRSSVDPKTGATRGSGAEMVRAKKMGGGQVMKYKKGGMVYKQGGGVVKASNSGDSLIAACYD